MYNKTNWVSKKTIISADAMNNIENGIEKLNDSINLIKDGAPEELDTFKEVADALGHHANLTRAIDEKINALGEDFNELKTDANQRVRQRFYSIYGEDIKVDNGANGHVVSGKIEGQTINSCVNIKTIQDCGFQTNTNQYCQLLDDGYIKLTRNASGGVGPWIKKECFNLKPSTVYTAIVIVRNNTMEETIQFKVNNNPHGFFENAYAFTNIKSGINKIKLTTKADFSTAVYDFGQTISLLSSNIDGSMEMKYLLLEGDWTQKELPIDEHVEFGLQSTKAIVKNNDIPYAFLNTYLEGKTTVLRALKYTEEWTSIGELQERDTLKYDYKLENVSDLGSVPTAKDYVDLSKKVKVLNTFEYVPSMDDDFEFMFTKNEYTWITVKDERFLDKDNYLNTNAVCNLLNIYPFGGEWYEPTKEQIMAHPNRSNALAICLKASSFEDAKKRLVSSGIRVRVKMNEPKEIALTEKEIERYKDYLDIIELNRIKEKADTLEILEDGSAVYVKNTSEYIFNGDEVINNFKASDEYSAFRIRTTLADLPVPKCWNDITTFNTRFEDIKYYDSYVGQPSKEYMTVENHATTKAFVISIKNDKLDEITTDGMKKYLKAEFEKGTPIKVKYQTVEPQQIKIPKELVPQIKTYINNTFSCGESVKADNYYLDVPVKVIYDNQSYMIELEKQIAELEYLQIMNEV